MKTNYEHQEKGSLEVWNKTETKGYILSSSPYWHLTPEGWRDSGLAWNLVEPQQYVERFFPRRG